MLSCALPRHRQPLDDRDGSKQQNSERAQLDETRPGQGPVQLRVGFQNEIAEPANRTDEFTDDRADHRERYGHF